MSRREIRKFGTAVITSGEYRGQTIMTPGGETHPMGSREKIAMFNMIADYLPDAFVLDAFAGSGALGIEALSRGARYAVCVDVDATAVDIINQNMQKLGIWKKGGGIQADIVLDSTFMTDRFSLVLADPPYDMYMPEMLAMISELVAPGGIMVASTPKEAPEIEGMKILKRKKYARAHITVYEQLYNGEHVEYPRLHEDIRPGMMGRI